MKKILALTAGLLFSLAIQPAFAQQTKGVIISLTGSGEVRADNDQAMASFFIEEQDKDKAVAASRVNQKMKQGTELLKKLDPEGKYATHGYYTYPVYQEPTTANRARILTGWRVGQYLELTTKNLLQLPASVAAVQSVLALNGLTFGLAPETAKNLEAKRLTAAYDNVQEKVQIVAHAMGRNPAEASIESLDFDASNNRVQPQPRMFAAVSPMMAKGNAVEETSFEPGQTVLSATVAVKIRFH